MCQPNSPETSHQNQMPLLSINIPHFQISLQILSIYLHVHLKLYFCRKKGTWHSTLIEVAVFNEQSFNAHIKHSKHKIVLTDS